MIVGQYACHCSPATEQRDYDMIVPRNNGQTNKQPTGYILHESHSVKYELRHQMTLKSLSQIFVSGTKLQKEGKDIS